MKLPRTTYFLFLSASAHGWTIPSKSVIRAPAGRRDFFVGVGGGFVGGATAFGAPAQVAAKALVYEPAPRSLAGKVIVVTGGSTGLGLESAKRLSAAGATVVLTSRTEAKGQAAVQEVSQYLENKGATGGAKLYSLVLDLDDLGSVRAFPGAYKKLNVGKIDVLMNNAGVMAIPDRQLTKDGFERTFQSNHLGHFVLTSGLYPLLSREKATVINVSSEAYNFASSTSGQGMDLGNLNGETKYGAWSSYGLSKLANIMFTQELQRRADAVNDSWLTAVTLHPGAVSTDLGRNLIGEKKMEEMKTKGVSGLEGVALKALSAFVLTVPEGASTQVYLAAGAEGKLKKAAFYDEMKTKSLPGWATDEVTAKKLWDKSEELGGVKFVFEEKQ